MADNTSEPMRRRDARKIVRKLILNEFAERIAGEEPAYLESQPEEVREVFIDEANRMGRRLASVYGERYPERA